MSIECVAHMFSDELEGLSEFGRVRASLGEAVTTTHSIDIRASTLIFESECQLNVLQ